MYTGFFENTLQCLIPHYKKNHTKIKSARWSNFNPLESYMPSQMTNLIAELVY